MGTGTSGRPTTQVDLDETGQTILGLLHQAAGVAEENSRRVLDMAQKLSHQLTNAQYRIAELEAELETSRENCNRADEWLRRVYAEIEDRFIRRS